MELDAYIDSLIEQGLSDNEIAIKVEEFKANQTTDENFQQDGVAGADAPSEIAAPEDTDSSLENISLDLQEQIIDPAVEKPKQKDSPYKLYKDKILNLQLTDEEIASIEAEVNVGPKTVVENVSFSELRASGLMKPGDDDYYPGGGIKKIEKQVYPYTPFLSQAKEQAKKGDTQEDIIESAKQLFIKEKRQKLIQKKSEETYEDLEKSVFTTGDRVLKFMGIKTPSEYAYEDIRSTLTSEVEQEKENKKQSLNNTTSKIFTHINAYNAANDEIVFIQKLVDEGLELNPEQLKVANGHINVANTSAEIIKTLESQLYDDIGSIEDLSTIADLTKRTYNNLDIARNRLGGTVMNLLAGLGTVADEFSPKKLIENFAVKATTAAATGFRTTGVDARLDLTNPEDLSFVPEKLQPIVFGLAKAQEQALEMTAGQLYENARNLNENTKLRQEMGEISSVEDFLEFSLDLFSEQAVNTAVTASTGGIGLGLVSAAAGGQKMNEMNIEIENGVKISPMQFYGAGLMYAGGEFISERVSMQQFNKILKIGTRKQFDLAQELTLENLTHAKAFKRYFKGVAQEGNSELFAQLFNNFADQKILDKDVSMTDGLGEAFLTGAFMSAAGFGAPVLATDLHRAFSSDKVLQENNERFKKIVSITKEINKLAPLADTDANAQQAIVALQQQQDKLHNKNIASMQSVHSLVDNLNNEDKRLLLDLDSQIYKNKRGIDKINANKKLSADRKKTLIEELADNNKTINEYKQEIINNSDYSIDKELARKTQTSIRAKTGLELEIIDGENTQDAYQKGIEFINNSELEPEAKEKLKNKLQAAILETDEFRAHGFQFGAEDGLAMSFQIKNNATDGKLGNSTVFSHELAHATVLKKLFEGDSDIISLMEDFQKYVSRRYKGAKEVFDTVERVYGDRSDAVIAEEKFNAIKDMFRKYKLQPDKTFQGKILTKWNKITKGDKKPPITEVETGQDVFDLMVSFASSFNKGEISGLAADFIEGKVKVIQKKPKKVKDTKAEPVDKDKATVFSKNKSQEDSKTKQTLDGFTGPAETRKYKTKAEFEASPDYLSAYNYFTEPNPSLDARINSVAAGKGVDFIDVQKVKDNLSLRFVQNFDVSKNSLFGWMLGKTPALNFAVLDVIKEETAKTPTTTTTTAEGATIDIADDVNIEDQIDAAMAQQTEAPRSALKQELQKDGQQFVDQVLEDAIETNTIEIFEGTKPEFTDAALVPFLKQASQQKSFKQIKNKVGDAMTFLKDNDNYKTLFHSKNLPVSVLVAMERNVPVADRIFTGEPTRLTTQDQINKAVNDGDFYVENEKTGPSTYPRKKPTVEQLEKFFNVPAVNPVTGKRSGLKGTRKDGLVNAVSFGLFRDITPSVMRKLDKPAADIAKTAEKLVVDPAIKFSLSAPDVKILKDNGITSYKLETNSDVDVYIKDLKKIIPIFNTDDFKILNRSVLQFTEKSVKEKSVRDYLRNELKKLQKQGLLPTRVTIGRTAPNKALGNNLNSFIKSIDSGVVQEYNEKHGQVFDKLWKTIKQTIEADNSTAVPIMYFLSNSINETTNPHRMGAEVIGYENISGKVFYEHAMQSTNAYRKLMQAILSKNNNFDTIFEEVKQNYKIIALSENSEKKLTKAGYKNKFLDKWNNWWQRYFNKEVAAIENGINPNILFNVKNKESFYNILSVNNKGEINESLSDVFVEDIKQFDTFGMADVVAGRLFQNEFKNLPRFKRNYNNLTKKQKAKVQREMLKQNLAPAKFNNKLLPAADQLTGEFTNDQVIAKMQEIDNKNIENEIKFSKSANLNKKFNEIIERSTGISATATISEARAAMAGARKGKFDIFISPSAEDFVGLLYKTLGKGKQGDADLKFYNDHLLKPFAKANNAITSERLALMKDYIAIKKQIGVVPKDLRKNLPGEDFTREQAVRVYVWTKQGMSIPGLTEGDLKKLLTSLKDFPELISFGNQLIRINKGDGYAAPQNNWIVGSITTDLLQGINTTKRAKHLQVWQDNVDVIFSKDNLNKLEAAYGKQYVEALKNILLRMKTGRNRTYGMDSLVGKLTDWINGSVGAIMFFNTRSAVLQTISAVNFINFKDNNIFAAGKAFANQKQYWTDFIKLFNSDFLLARRDGLRMNVNEADIAETAKKGGVRGVINELLRLGFTPTQLADSFAIASGGSTFYRNRIKTYLKETDVDGNKIYTQKEAEAKAFEDFRENAEESQQSSRPDKISQQQSGSLGRLVLAFANTPSQYARIIKKAALDLKNGRGDAKTNISKIVYYTFAQNLLFNALQQGLFALAFGDDKEDEKKKEKTIGIANGMANSLLRGMGFYGAAVAAVKDGALRIYKESQEKQPKYEKVSYDFLSISPPIQSKFGKIAAAGRDIQYAKKDQNFKDVSIDNPALSAGARVVSATTNIPLDRLVFKTQNINDALNQDVEYWEKTALLLGWSGWSLGIEDDKDKKEKAEAVRIKRREVKRREVKRR